MSDFKVETQAPKTNCELYGHCYCQQVYNPVLLGAEVFSNANLHKVCCKCGNQEKI